ncbi:MAG: 6-phosphofructokinase [candidate division Zixibacteria bacterium]|nr:6-phosphofructokinase [candidate division Zixibacteria bacterium]
MRIGILTGGGDCPGLNAVIRAIVIKSINKYDDEVIGILEGWRGLLEEKYIRLQKSDVRGIIFRGGTILKTSRTNPNKIPNGIETIKKNIEKAKIDVIAAIGGEDTLGVAKKLHDAGIKVVGIPKTIDNDLEGTDYTFGFDTAVNVAMEAIDRVHSTAESHNRALIVEVMGRHTGWIAIESGLASGADVILIPEKPFDVDSICDVIKKRHDNGKDFTIIVVAEGAKFKVEAEVDGTMILQDMEKDAFGHVRLGGIASVLAKEIEKRTGFEARYVILGHIQRGGTPTAFDRVLATRFGVAAVDLIHQGDFGKMVALKGLQIVPVPLEDALAKTKVVPDDLYSAAEVFFG